MALAWKAHGLIALGHLGPALGLAVPGMSCRAAMALGQWLA